MPALYGRADLLASAQRYVARVCAGDGKLLLFTGEPGIGKSRLVEQIANEAERRGAKLAWGRCWEAGGAPAYWPWIQVFRQLGMESDPFAQGAVDLSVNAPELRFALFDRAVRSVRALAATQPLALLLDDLHAADAPSLLLLLMLARELAGSGILVVGAYRDAELRLTPELSALLGKIAREGEVFPLTRLGRSEVAEWLRDLKLTDADARAGELYRLTEGHPLFMTEALRLGAGAAAQAAWSRGTSAVLDERLSRLTGETRGLLRAAAVLGREFSLPELSELADAGSDFVYGALAEATAMHIAEAEGVAERYRFTHLLLRDRLYLELTPTQRASLHVRAGERIMARAADARAAVHHMLEGQSAAAPEQVARVAFLAAETALAHLAFEEVVTLCRRARQVPHTLLPPALLGRLQVLEAEALIRLGESAQGKELCVEAAACAEHISDHELLGRAALAYGTELSSGTIDPQMVALLRRGLEGLPDTSDSALRSRLMVRLAAALTPPVHVAQGPEILGLMREGTLMARRLGDLEALVYALQFGATVGLLVPEHERLGLMEETLTLARSLDQPLVLLQTLPAFITALIAIGERARAESHLPEFAQLLQQFRAPVHRMRFLLVNALLLALRGDREEAEQLSAEAGTLAQHVGSASLLWLTHRLALAQLHEAPERLHYEGPIMLARLASSPAALPHAAWLLIGLGRHEEARALLQKRQLDEEPTIPTLLWDLIGHGEACVLLQDAELAPRVYAQAQRAAGRMFWNISPGAILGPSARVLGDLALLMGDRALALRHYEEALAFCRKLGAPLLVAQCEERRERVLAQLAHASSSAMVEAARTSLSARRSEDLTLTREGDVWTLSGPGLSPLRIKHVKGLAYLECLLAQPGLPVHVLELAGIDHRVGDAGPVLDARAKAAYRERLEQLRDALSEAERFADSARSSRLQEEMEVLAEQLASAMGLGGRDRRAASEVERTRVNVQRRLKDAIERIGALDPALGRYLSSAVKTGTTCVFRPV